MLSTSADKFLLDIQIESLQQVDILQLLYHKFIHFGSVVEFQYIGFNKYDLFCVVDIFACWAGVLSYKFEE